MENRNIFNCGILLIVSLLLNLVMSNMSPIRDCLFCCDVNIFYMMGKSWALGYVPYVDFVDTKGPLLMLIFAIGYLISPDKTFGVYLLASLATAVTLIYIYKLAVYYMGSSLKAVLVALACSACLFFKPYYGYGPRIEQFLLPFIVLEIYFCCVVTKQLRTGVKPCVLFGSCLGLSAAVFFLTKYLYIIFPLSVLACLVVSYLTCENGLKIAGWLICSFIASFFVLVLPFLAYILYTDSLDEFIWSYFTLSTEYVSEGKPMTLFAKVSTLLVSLVAKCGKEPAFWVALIAICSLFTPFYLRNMNCRTRCVCFFSFLALILGCSMGFWRYYLLMYFPLVLFPLIIIADKIPNRTRILLVLCCSVIIFELGNYLTILSIRKNQVYKAADPSWCMDHEKVENILRRKEHAKILYLDQLDQGLGIRTGAVPACPIWFSWYSENDDVRQVRIEAVKNRVPDFVFTCKNVDALDEKLLRDSGYKPEIHFINYAAAASAITLWSRPD